MGPLTESEKVEQLGHILSSEDDGVVVSAVACPSGLHLIS